MSRRATAPFRLVLRARIVLLAADGLANCVIAERLGICEDTARKWRRRYCEQGIDGLADAPRPGRPRVFPARGRGRGQGPGVRDARRERDAAGPLDLPRAGPPRGRQRHHSRAVSPSTVRRWLADDALKPWQHRSWIFPRDPHFALKAGRVLDLYQREWEGQPLGEDEYVLSADEKPGVQARMRIHLPLPPGPGRAMRAESEYHRYGTLAYLAAYDVHRARVIGRCEPSTGIKPFTALVDQVMSSRAVRLRAAGLLGRGQRRLAPQLGRRRPPQRRLPQRADGPPARPCLLAQPGRGLLLRPPAQAPHPRRLRGPRSLAAQILAFEQHYNATARPFDWKFTRTDLNQLLARIRKHDRHAPHPLAA